MIRPEEIEPLLASVRGAIEGILKPDLASDQTRAAADAALMTLDRIVTDIRNGDAIAAPRLKAWEDIRAGIPVLGIDAPVGRVADFPGFLGALHGLQVGVDGIQRLFGNDAGLAALVARLRSGDAGANAWFRSAVTALADLHDASETVVPKAAERKDAADTAAEALRLRKALNAYFKLRYPQLPAEPVTALRLVPGGYSKQTAIFSLVPNDVLPEQVVLRRDMAHSITPTSVNNEYPYMQQAFAAGVKTPRPLLLESDPSFLGGTFMLMSEIPQATPSGTYFPEDRLREPSRTGPDFGKEVAATLAQLHSRTRVTDARSIPNYKMIALESHTSWCKFSPKAPLSLTMELSYAWLLSHPPRVDRPYCTVHGDFGTHNVLVRDGHLAALVDWELSAVGDPADDLAQCRMLLLPGIMEWEDFVREYVAAGGDPAACDLEAVAYFCVALFIKHCLNNLTLRNAFLRGERTDIGAATLISHYGDRVLQYQARALGIAIDARRE